MNSWFILLSFPRFKQKISAISGIEPGHGISLDFTEENHINPFSDLPPAYQARPLIPRNFAQFHAIPRNSTQFRAVPRNSAQFRAVPRNSAQFRIVPRNSAQRSVDQKPQQEENISRQITNIRLSCLDLKKRIQSPNTLVY